MIKGLLVTFLLLISFTSYSQVQYVVSTLAGRENSFGDGAASIARFRNPSSICIDSSGNLFVADTWNHRIRKVSPNGVVTTFAGSGIQGNTDGIGTSASFFSPSGITIDASGILYITDSNNNRIRKISPNGIVTTLAYGFNFPCGIAVDTIGNVFVADTYNHRICKITPSGVVTTLAGSGNRAFLDGTGTLASFNLPKGLVLDAIGNIYIADYGNNRIRKVTQQGVVTTFAGSGRYAFADGTGTGASINNPSGIARDDLGNLYIADCGNNRIRKINDVGVVTTIAGTGTTGLVDGTRSLARFNKPTGVAVDESGNVIVADELNCRIRKIAPTGIVSTLAGSDYGHFAEGIGTDASFYVPHGIAVDASKNVYVADDGNRRIRKITNAGVVSTFAGSGNLGEADGAATQATFINPLGVALDTFGNLFVLDCYYRSIRKINPSGIVTTIVPGNYNIAQNRSRIETQGITVDNSGNIYLSDMDSNWIRKITPSGIVTTLAGSGNAAYLDGIGASSSFNKPYGIAVDATGNVYVADTYNNRIRKITSSGVVTTLAGSGVSGYEDGIGTAASFLSPYVLTLDAFGNVFVGDVGNNRIRKITPSGIVTTIAGSGNAGFNDGLGTSASFFGMFGMAVDTSGNIYVSSGDIIRKMKPCNVTRSSLSRTICESYSFVFGGISRTTSGTYYDTIPNAAGCDSIITLNLTISPISYSISDRICDGSTYTFGNRILTASGIYFDTLTRSASCDSIITLNLAVNPLPVTPTVVQSNDTLYAISNGNHFQWYRDDSLLVGDTLSYYKTNFRQGTFRVVANLNSCNSPSSSVFTDVNDKTISNFSIFPNPASSHFTIEVISPTTVQVLNLLGQVVISQKLSSGKTDVNTSMLSNGTYVVLAEGFDATRLVVSK